MIVVISQEHKIEQEAGMVNAMFDRGLDVFHFRKRGGCALAEEFLRQIDPIHHHKIAVYPNDHNPIPKSIRRLHFSSPNRRLIARTETTGMTLSTSCHRIAEFNSLSSDWDYSFLSPFYPSISKPGYGNKNGIYHDLWPRKMLPTRLIALSGITYENLPMVLQWGADGAALSGAVWSANDPVDYLERCVNLHQEIRANSYEKSE